MGNLDVVIVFNDGLFSVVLKGTEYNTITEAIQTALSKWDKWLFDLEQSADCPEEITHGIRTIRIYEFDLNN